MKICRLLLLILMLVYSSSLYGGEFCKYEQGNVTYEVGESKSQYVVVASLSSATMHSRSLQIQENRLRLKAIDLIGAYILYKDFASQHNISYDYFQVYTQGINLHYNAVISNLQQERILSDNDICYRYICDKSDYDIKNATYIPKVNLQSLLVANYHNCRNEVNALLLCNYNQSTAEDYFNIESDFLQGNMQTPPTIRLIQAISDRLETSLFASDMSSLESVVSNAMLSLPNSHIFRALHYIELTSAAPLKDKIEFYNKWQSEIDNIGNIWNDILSFSAKECKSPLFSEMSITETIVAFSGAISPYSIRQATYEPNYDVATQRYANSQFEETIAILTESIDVNGISPRALNLLGASYRLADKPNLALPYLILCFRMAPNTPYLVGNISLCLQKMKYNKIYQAIDFLLPYANDSWSQEQLKNIKL